MDFRIEGMSAVRPVVGSVSVAALRDEVKPLEFAEFLSDGRFMKAALPCKLAHV
jgi:hypothetical protein